MRTRKLQFFVLGIVSTILTALPVSAAQRIYVSYGSLSFSFSVQSLETFAQQGKIESGLRFFLKRLSP